MDNQYEGISYTFSNGITVVNTTPHSLNFLSPEGEKIVVPSSVPEGEKTGFAVINAKSVEESFAPHTVDTAFVPDAEGNKIIDEIKNAFPEQQAEGNLMIIGSMIAANAYPDVKGMCPAPGYERVPPAEKLMSSEKFTIGQAKSEKDKEPVVAKENEEQINKNIFSYDAETNGLWGQAFSIGAIVADSKGKIIDQFVARCPVEGEINDWVKENVLPQMEDIPVTHGSYEEMLNAFCDFYAKYKDNSDTLTHMGHIVESKLWRDMHDKNIIGDWDAPYIAMDACTFEKVRDSVDGYAKENGISVDPKNFAGGTHNPLYDSAVTLKAYVHERDRIRDLERDLEMVKAELETIRTGSVDKEELKPTKAESIIGLQNALNTVKASTKEANDRLDDANNQLSINKQLDNIDHSRGSEKDNTHIER